MISDICGDKSEAKMRCENSDDREQPNNSAKSSAKHITTNSAVKQANISLKLIRVKRKSTFFGSE